MNRPDEKTRATFVIALSLSVALVASLVADEAISRAVTVENLAGSTEGPLEVFSEAISRAVTVNNLAGSTEGPLEVFSEAISRAVTVHNLAGSTEGPLTVFTEAISRSVTVCNAAGLIDQDGDCVPDLDDNCPTLANPAQQDCDNDGIGDACAIAEGISQDCNGNGIPDACDIADGTSLDADFNGIPDECLSDADSDGVLDDDDNCPNTPNPGQLDTDGDGIGDVCDLDDDNDGLLDTDEAAFGTDPLNADTDADGLLDGTEVDLAEGGGCPDPTVADSDGDTLSDGFEVLTIGTNPCLADSDGDGVPDNVDPSPLVPGVSTGFLEDAARELGTEDIPTLDLGTFNGPNNNANEGRRNSLANRASEAANLIAAGDLQGAINKLNSLLSKIDGQSPPPDWMNDSPEKTALRIEVELLIALLEMEL